MKTMKLVLIPSDGICVDSRQNPHKKSKPSKY